MAIDVKNTIAQWRQEIVMTLKESTKSARILCVLLVFFYALSGYILVAHPFVILSLLIFFF